MGDDWPGDDAFGLRGDVDGRRARELVAGHRRKRDALGLTVDYKNGSAAKSFGVDRLS